MVMRVQEQGRVEKPGIVWAVARGSWIAFKVEGTKYEEERCNRVKDRGPFVDVQEGGSDGSEKYKRSYTRAESRNRVLPPRGIGREGWRPGSMEARALPPSLEGQGHGGVRPPAVKRCKTARPLCHATSNLEGRPVLVPAPASACACTRRVLRCCHGKAYGRGRSGCSSSTMPDHRREPVLARLGGAVPWPCDLPFVATAALSPPSTPPICEAPRRASIAGAIVLSVLCCLCRRSTASRTMHAA